MTATPIELRAGELRLLLRPDLGGCIAGCWHGAQPVLHSVADAAALDSPRESGGFVMAPYGGRLGQRRFRWHGQDHVVATDSDGGAHAAHGVAWQRPWQVVAAGDDAAELLYRQAADAHWPFDFTLRQRLRLSADALQLDLLFTNSDPRAQPVGLGWHPLFARRSRSRLHIELTDRWEADPASRLPTRKVTQPGIDGDIAHLGFDHCFEGWRGAARIRDEKLSLRLDGSVAYLLVSTPQDRPWFSVAPLSHVAGAIHMAEPAAHGLRSVPPGATLDASFRLEVATL